jgi:fatty acid desaturase
MGVIEEGVAQLRKDKRNVALPYLFLVYLLLGGLLAAPAFLDPLHWFWLVPAMGIVQYYVVISGHEAVHKTLCFPEKLNDFMGVFGQALVGVNFTAYRQQHIDHHRADSHEQDPDAHIYYGVVSTPSGLRRFLKLTLGTLVEIIVKIHQKGTGGFGSERKLSDKVVFNKKRDSLLVILAQLSLMGICTLSVGGLPAVIGDLLPAEGPLFGALHLGAGMVWSYAVLWIIPLFCVTVFLNRCRIVVEHGLALKMAEGMEGDFGGPRIPTVDIVPGPVQRRLFAPFLFNYHCSHHLFMSVPHYNLPRLNRLLREVGHEGHHGIEGSYITALGRAMRAE